MSADRHNCKPLLALGDKTSPGHSSPGWDGSVLAPPSPRLRAGQALGRLRGGRSREPTPRCAAGAALLGIMGVCGRSSLRGFTWKLDTGAGPGLSEALHPAPVLGTFVPSPIRAMRAIFKGTASTERCVVETIRLCKCLNPVKASVQTFTILVGGCSLNC